MIPATDLAAARALVWLRWRLLVNSLIRSTGRDWLERVSRAAAASLPLALAVLIVPPALGLAGAALFAGLAVGADPRADPGSLSALRAGLGLATVFALLSPVMFGAAHTPAGLVRLLLLPISRRLLYAAHALGGLLDLWLLAVLPAIAVFAAAVLAVAPVRGLAVIGAAVLTVAALSGLAAVVSAAGQAIVRDRRRAELLLLGSLLLLGALIVGSAMLDAPESPHSAGDAAEAAEAEAPPTRMERVAERLVTAAIAASPGELLVAAARSAGGPPIAPLAKLALWVVAGHGLAWHLYTRLLQAPPVSRRRPRGTGLARFSPSVPLLGAQASAVALAAVRLVWRSPQGRLNVLMPVVFITAMAVALTVGSRGVPLGPVRIGGGVPVALFGLYFATASLGAFLCNQFAADGRGLTLLLLSPLPVRVVLLGKAVGGFATVLPPAAIAVAAGFATGHIRPPVVAALGLGAAASWLIFAPVAAILSAVFPQPVDLSRIGSRSHPHQAANLLAQLVLGATGGLAALAAWLGHRLGGPGGMVAAASLFATAAAAGCLVLFALAERIVDRRRENLALVAEGR
ncbi:MAG TPA: hypothetical protein VNI83_07170 [Vicinamibacterales bacterium]|nr:hypothetical protein [Vicinamibacterales bacterium]